jgi:hypothetical protein
MLRIPFLTNGVCEAALTPQCSARKYNRSAAAARKPSSADLRGMIHFRWGKTDKLNIRLAAVDIKIMRRTRR